jgi:hypothetical protein
LVALVAWVARAFSFFRVVVFRFEVLVLRAAIEFRFVSDGLLVYLEIIRKL